jgi:hypothetical protein
MLYCVYCIYSWDVYAFLWEDVCVYGKCNFMGRIMFMGRVCVCVRACAFMRRRVLIGSVIFCERLCIWEMFLCLWE